MNNRLISVVVFALVVSGVVSFILYQFITNRITANANTPTAAVVVAVRPLPMGTLVKETDVKTTQWTGALPHGALTKVEDVVGRGVTSPIVEDEPLVDSRLAPKGGGAGMAATIPKGMRAVAVSVNEVVGVAGFVTPGMKVDVLVSGNPPGGSALSGPRTQTVLQNIEVLSAGQNFQKDAEGKPVAVQVVNLLVTPEQAETLSLASHETRIQLVLRNPMDTDIAKTPGTAVAKLFGNWVPDAKPQTSARPSVRRPAPAPAPVAEPKPVPPVIIEVYHGDKKTELKFQPERESSKQ